MRSHTPVPRPDTPNRAPAAGGEHPLPAPAADRTRIRGIRAGLAAHDRPRPARALAIALAMWLFAQALPAAGATVTIDFDTYPGGGAVPPGPSIGAQWMSLGVVFEDILGGPAGASNNSCSLSPPNHAYAGTIVATFVDPTTGQPAATSYVGTAQDWCWVPGEGIAIRAYDITGNLVGSVFNPSSGSNGGGHFESLSFPSPIVHRVEMDCILQGIDDFVFDAPTPVDVGEAPSAFGLARLANPSFGGSVAVSFSLPAAGAAWLELLDAGGRRVEAREVGSLGPGLHRVRLGEGRRLAPGVYFVRLSQGTNRAVSRVAMLD